MKKINIMDPFKELPLEIALKILTRLPVEWVRHCKSICRKWRKIVDIHFNDHFKKLPYETRLDILSRLPGDTVLDCKSVCRNWRKIVGVVSKDPEFIRMHLNHPSAAAQDSCKSGFLALSENEYHYFEYNDELTKPIKKVRKINSKPFGGTNIVGSCNGLVFLCPGFIWNPLTKEYVELPDIGNHIDMCDAYDEYMNWSYGFGYVPSTDEYKVVATYVSRSKYVQVYIYTVGSGNGWRNLGKFDSEFSPMRDVILGHGRFANGAIYWIGREVDKIVTFDLIEEKFCQHLAPPPLKPGWKLLDYIIGVLDGFLYIPMYDRGEDRFVIWLLKEKNGNHGKDDGDKHQSFEWSKEYRVNECYSFAITKSGGVLTYNENDYYVNLYDTKASTSEMLVDFYEMVLQVLPHKNTFVSLKELGEEDTETVSEAS